MVCRVTYKDSTYYHVSSAPAPAPVALVKSRIKSAGVPGSKIIADAYMGY